MLVIVILELHNVPSQAIRLQGVTLHGCYETQITWHFEGKPNSGVRKLLGERVSNREMFGRNSGQTHNHLRIILDSCIVVESEFERLTEGVRVTV